MTAVRSRVALGAMGFALGCGNASSGAPAASGTDVSCSSPGMYISNSTCVDLPPFSAGGIPLEDARASSDDAASDEGGPANDGSDASSTRPPDPLSPCASADDVLVVEVENSGFSVSQATYTRLNATFASNISPLAIDVTPNPNQVVGGFGDLTLFDLTLTVSRAPTITYPVPGTYEINTFGIEVNLFFNGGAQSFESGTVVIDDLQINESEGTPGRLHSLLLSYRLITNVAQTISGCARYIESTEPQAPRTPA